MGDAYSPVPELNLLKEFEDSLEGEFFAPGFELFEYNDDLDWFCGDAPDAYLERLIPFAYATASGSFYALWRCDDRADLAALPVIGFGDEGGLWVEACNLRHLFRLLAFEPKDFEDRAGLVTAHQKYVAWLERTFGITTQDNAEYVDGDLDDYEERFALWISEFADEELLEHVLEELGLDELPTR